MEKMGSAVRREGSHSAPLCQEGPNSLALAQLARSCRGRQETDVL